MKKSYISPNNINQILNSNNKRYQKKFINNNQYSINKRRSI